MSIDELGNEKDREGKAMAERAMRIMEALSGIDEELLQRSGRKRGIVRPLRQCTQGRVAMPLWRRAQVLAAALCLALVGIVSWNGYRLVREGGSDGSFGMSGASVAGDNGSPGEMLDMTAGMEAEVTGELQQGADGGWGEASSPESPEAACKVGGEYSASLDKRMDSSDANGGAGEEDSATGVGFDNSGDQVVPKLESNLVANIETLTEEEARGREKLGNYVPTALPRGYVFSGASRNLDKDTDNLTVFWVRGMDTILWSVEIVDVAATVDVSKPETYDERLYEIPYGESVPQEYRESFFSPVFALEDFDLEIVASRMISHQDSGDTDTPRGHFDVLYPDGVLVRFNGRGTAEQIWEMFSSVGEQ